MLVRADRPAAVAGAEGLAGVLDERETVGGGELGEAVELGRVAEDVDGEDPSGALGDRGPRRVGIHVQRSRVDVHEDRRRALEEDRVGRGDERKRGRDDLVSRAQPSQPHREVQAGRSARDRRDVLRADASGELRLEAVGHRAERQATRTQRLDRELLLPLPQPGSGHWNLRQDPGVGAFSGCSGR